jgi:hypothetical protein
MNQQDFSLIEENDPEVILVKESGELGKFGPGSKARGQAKSPKVRRSSGSIFVQGFNQPLIPHRTPRIAPKLQENPLNRNNPGQGACTNKQNNQDGTLTREQLRNLPSPDDVMVSEQNVIIRDGQARYKIKNHGHEFGIKSTLNSKGRCKTEKTRENIEAFKEEIKKLVLNGERIEGTYRKSEPDGYRASHFYDPIYDPITGKNVIFKKETREFVSAWKLTEGQVDDLLTNGNVGDY